MAATDAIETDMRTVVLHYHLFKNAGTSLDKVLQENFGDKWVTREFQWNDNPEEHTRELGEWIVNNPDAIAFSSHTAELPPPHVAGIRIIPLIFVRHPLDRIASAYYFDRKQKDSVTFGAVLARNTTLRGYAEVGLHVVGDRQCRNFHTERFAKTYCSTTGTELERALRAVRELPFVGVVDRFDESMAKMEEMLQPFFSDFAVVQAAENVSRDISIRLEDRLIQLRETLAETFDVLYAANKDDLMLYESALKKMIGSDI